MTTKAGLLSAHCQSIWADNEHLTYGHSVLSVYELCDIIIYSTAAQSLQ